MNAVYATFMFLALVLLVLVIAVLLWIVERERHDRRRISETLLNALNTDTTGEFIAAESQRRRAEVPLEHGAEHDPLADEFLESERRRGRGRQPGWPADDVAVIGSGRGI